ncbi:sensor histidine kinase [Streptomyces mirabilis]|uniref:sensor histidine kinase n=1 Tax=Streptomyces mirabilis TaxID=68239 RepID=UPI00369DF5F7
MWRRASLRSRVLLLAVALLATGLTAFSLAAGNALRDYMESRVDSQLGSAAQVFALVSPAVAQNRVEHMPTANMTEFSTGVLGNPILTYVSADGAVEKSIDSLAGGNRKSSTRGPALPRLDTAAVAAHGGRPFTVSSTQGDTRWRVIAIPRVSASSLSGATATRPASSDSVVVSTSLAQVDSTVGRMWRIYRSTGFALLTILAVAGWFAVRSGLRPLSRIEQTAAEIASGDLSCRIPELSGPKTELGRLTAALNGMLRQLETAFAARAESEARMSRFVADASHELRTPLAGIKGLTDLYSMGALADQGEIDAAMDRIARESERLTRLVNDMLQLARLDEHALRATGKPAGLGRPNSPVGLDLDLAPADLRTLAADALHDVRALDPTRTVTLTGPAGDGPPASAPALADESRLRQVVTNLVGNAVTHTHPGTSIRIGVGTIADHAVLEVADDGPGLTAEQSTRIFERFYRADTSRTRATGGSGLGLAIAHSLVTAHAGHITVDSAPGRGATFRIALPRLTDQHPPADSPEGVVLQG